MTDNDSVNVQALENKLLFLEKAGVKAIDLQYVDTFGKLKCKTVSFKEFMHEKEYQKGYKIDGSSVAGFGVPVCESDVTILPDMNSVHNVPWAKDVARVICSVYTKENNQLIPFEADPRNVLKKVCSTIPSALSDIKANYFEYHVCPEFEFFLLDKDFQFLDKLGYHDEPPKHIREFLTKVMEAMGEMGLQYEAYHHEVAPSQYEFTFRYGEAVEIADAAITLKDILRNYASERGWNALFMPKPFYGMNGSGMHCHLNLSSYTKDGENKIKTNLFRGSEPKEYSELAKYFIAGLLDHAPAITAISNPICNSYKRLVSGWEAPVKLACGPLNRTALIRLPDDDEKAARCEYRSPDPSCNPYLTFAVMLAAGLDGIKNKKNPPAFTTADLFHNGKDVPNLPGSLDEALDSLVKDSVINGVLGERLFSTFMAAKRKESEQYRTRPSNIDFEFYANV